MKVKLIIVWAVVLLANILDFGKAHAQGFNVSGYVSMQRQLFGGPGVTGIEFELGGVRTLSDERGFFTFSNVTPGTYTLSVTATIPGYEVDSISNPVQVTTYSPNPLSVKLRCATGYRFINNECIADGQRLPVRPFFECSEPRADGSALAYFGYFNENNLPVTIPVGEKNLVTLSESYQIFSSIPTLFLPGYNSRAMAIEIPNSGESGGATWRLEQLQASVDYSSIATLNARNNCGVGPFTVSGSVSTEDGTRVPGVLVTNGILPDYTYSDLDGYFELRPLPVGSHHIFGVKPGYSPFLSFNFENPLQVASNNGALLLQGSFEGEPQTPTEPIIPIAECLEPVENDPTRVLAYFGYENHNSFAVEIPAGANNYFSSSTQANIRSDYNIFLPGRRVRNFAVYLRNDAPTLWTWHLNGQEATISLDSPQCVRSAPPQCDAGAAYSAFCQGDITRVKLDGSRSIDPEQQQLLYTWNTSCGKAEIRGADSVSPELLLRGPGLGKEEACEAILAVSDGYGTSVCSAGVRVSACQQTCSSSERDRCGLCHGTNSCLGCIATKHDEPLETLHSSLERISRSFNALFLKGKHLLKRNAIHRKSPISKQIRKIRTGANNAAQLASSAIAVLPRQVLHCPVEAGCAPVALQPTRNEYLRNVTDLVKLFDTMRKILRKNRLAVKGAQKLKREISMALSSGRAATALVPDSNYVCSQL